MSQPTPYNRQASFTTIQQEAPTDPLPGNDLDAELNAVKTTLDQILNNIALIQRDDGDLANDSVGLDQIDESVSLGFNAPSSWLTATAYTAPLDTVFQGGSFYKCLVSHTSGVFADDLAAAKWELIADLTGGGGGGGSGDVVGPGGATTGHVAIYGDATGKLLADGGALGSLAAKSVVATVDLASSAVTYAKIQNVTATARILGRKTAAAGVVEECTLSEILDLIGSVAQGDILYRSATGWARLAAGTSGTFLKTQGAAANPVWDTPPAASGDVTGPGTNTDSKVPQWNGNNSKTLKDGLTVGAAANNLVQLDGSAKLPAVDGSQLTNINAVTKSTDYVLPVGTAAYLCCAGGGVANGATTSGANLTTFSLGVGLGLDLNADSFPDAWAIQTINGTTQTSFGAAQTGTWLNVSGTTQSAGSIGMWVRTA